MRPTVLRRALALGMTMALVFTSVATAAVWTDQADYAPGSVVTISGDNSNDAGYLPGETVDVAVVGPNGYEASCSATVDDAGAWSCHITLWDSYLAEGDYTYTAGGLTSGVSETGTFTDHGPSPVTSSNFSITASATFLVTVSVVLGGGSTTVTLTDAEANIDGHTGDLALTGPGGNGNGTWSGSFQGTCATTYKINNIKVTWNRLHAHTSTEFPGTPQPQVTTGACPPANSLPVVTANDDSFDEGTSKTYTASWTDADAGQTHSCTIDFGDEPAAVAGTISPAQPSSSGTCSASHTYADGPTSYIIIVTVSDGVGSGSDTATATVNNLPPVITSFDCPADPVAVNTEVTLSGAFTDAGVLDTHTASIAWGDSSSSSASVTEANGSGTVSGSHTYTAAGIYTPALTVTDIDGDSDTEDCEYVVVYDPSAGFVTGGGWIWSPAGAYLPDDDLEGKATFGFVSKYKKGATVPDGSTEFQFHAAGLNFKSTEYQWLVVSGSKATYKGYGTLNGVSGYGFLLSAIDGSPDKFRIKIWEVGGDIVYDNNLGGGDDADPATALGGGSIVIHTGGKN